MKRAGQISGFGYVACILAVVSLYLVTRPYVGLYHDGLLYAAQALQVSGIHDLSADLFFSSGNQSAFSLFPQVQGILIRELGLTPAVLLLQLSGAAVWVLSAVFLARVIYVDRFLALGALMVALVMFPHYGNGPLSYAENLLTPRPFAEAFGMMAIALALRDRHVVGLGFVALCFIFHPLTALGAMAIWTALTLKSVVLVIAAALIAAAAVWIAANAGIDPATWLLQTYDPAWKQILVDRSSMGFISLWSLPALQMLAVPFVVMAVATGSPNMKIAQLARIVILMSFLLVAIGFVGADIYGNRLIGALQFWRVLGWFTLIGNLLALHLVVTWGANKSLSVLLIATIAVSGVEHMLDRMPIFSPVFAVLLGLAVVFDQRGRFWKFLRWSVLALAVPVLVGAGSLIYIQLVDETTQDAVQMLVRFGLIAIAGLVFAAARDRTFLAALLAVFAMLGSITLYDARDGWSRFVEGPYKVPQRLQSYLADKTVYWEDGLSVMWIKLGQPQYYSCEQGAGSLFFDRQATEFERRARLLAPLDTIDFNQYSVCPGGTKSGQDDALDWKTVQTVCRAAPELDVLVLNDAVPGLTGERVRVGWGRTTRELHVFTCAEIR